MIQPGILPGFMELLPEEQVRFNEIRDLIREGFERYGFFPLDTPVIEKSEILLSKGGGETTKQIYHIDKSSTPQALRFDLTVPLARYVAMYQSSLTFPFKRYQIGKVFRGERNQRGRYREFYQCDIDIIGRDTLSIVNDAEIPAVMYDIFRSMGLTDLLFRVNNRKLLNAFFKQQNIPSGDEVLRIVDKLEKIGEQKVRMLLSDNGLSEEQESALLTFIQGKEDNEKTLFFLSEMGLSDTEGYAELSRVYSLMQAYGIPKENIKIDLSITRGLDYYTGTVYETFIKGHEGIGSICSGGRYDDLAGNFTKQKFPGIGLSIGLTRLFYQLTEEKMLKNDTGTYLQCVVIPMGEEDLSYGIDVVQMLRREGIRTGIYAETGKLKKKFTYVDQLNASYAVILGTQERENGTVSLRNMKTGEQCALSFEELADVLKKGYTE